MHAVDDLSDALETTRRFLTPVRVGLWLRLAVVVVFVSSLGLGLGPSVFGSDFAVLLEEPTPAVEQPPELEDEPPLEEELPLEELLVAAVVLGAIALILWLCYALVAGIMEFVFIESLRSTEVHVRRSFLENLGRGARLFLFRLGLLLVATVLGAIPVALVAFGEGTITDLSAGWLAAYSLYGFGLYLTYSVLRRFTDEFVAPIMLLEERGVLGAWRRFWGTLTANPAEYVVYLVLFWILLIAVTITAWLIVGMGLFALVVTFGLVIALLVVVLGSIGGLLALPVVLVGFAVGLLFMALVWMPITTYFQYYALLILGDTNAELDLIADQRAAVRADDDHGTGQDGWTSGSESWDDRDPWEDADESDPWEHANGVEDADSSADSDRTDEVDPWRDVDGTETDPWADTNGDTDDGNDDGDDDRSW